MLPLGDTLRKNLLAAAVTLAAASAGPALAQVSPAPAPADVPTAAPTSAPAIAPRADQVLREVSAFFQKVDHASVQFKIAQSVEAQGMKQQMDSTCTAIIQRPNKLAMTLRSGMMSGSAVVSDGKQLYAYMPMFRKYAVETAPQSLDSFSENPMGLAPLGTCVAPAAIVISLFTQDPYAAAMKGVTNLSYVGVEQVDGVACHHLTCVQEPVPFDIFVQQGPQPLIRRLVPDLSKQLAQMQQMAGGPMKMTMVIDLTDWQIDQAVAADAFGFTPPAGAAKVDSVMQLFSRPQQPGPQSSISK